MNKRDYSLFFILMIFGLSLFINPCATEAYHSAFSDQQCCSLFPQRFYIGPEATYMKRERKGGTKQSGWLYGGYAGYERVKACDLYWGVEGHWIKGILRGKDRCSNELRSKKTDAHVEGRIGWTLPLAQPTKGWGRCWDYSDIPTFTPYAGFGFFWGRNDFTCPSPLHVRFENKFPYIGFGFLSTLYYYNSWRVGMNFKAKFPWNGRTTVRSDPIFGTTHFRFGSNTHYEAELPFTYKCYTDYGFIESAITPFWRHRSYGDRECSPFDFIETRFNLYGIRLSVSVDL